MTRVRNFEDVRFGEYLIKTWYYSPYPKPSPIEDRAASPAPIASASKKRKLNGDASVNGNGLHLHDSNGVKREQSVQELYALGKSKVADGVKGRLWVCDVSRPLFAVVTRQILTTTALLQIYAYACSVGTTHRMPLCETALTQPLTQYRRRAICSPRRDEECTRREATPCGRWMVPRRLYVSMYCKTSVRHRD